MLLNCDLDFCLSDIINFAFILNFSATTIIYLTDDEVKNKIQNIDQTDKLYITFMSKMEVTEQFWSYGLLAYIAECGGFVGLFLGYSLMQLKDVMIFLGKPLKSSFNCL